MVKTDVYTYFLLLLTLIATTMSACNMPGIRSYGGIEPDKDFELAVGQDLTLNCTIDNKYTEPFQPSDIKWYSKDIPWDKFSTVVDERTVQLKIPNVTKSHSGNYACKLKIEQELADLCSREVTIREPPLATNFNCISMELTSLNCTWHSQPNDNQTSWTLIGAGVDWQECIEQNRCPYYSQLLTEEDKCALGGSTHPGEFKQTLNNRSSSKGQSLNRKGYTSVKLPVCNSDNITNITTGSRVQFRCFYSSTNFDTTKWNYSFTLVGQNSVANVSQNYNLDVYRRVVPPPPKDLQILQEGISTLRFSWCVPDVMKNHYIRVNYRLQYRSQWNNTWITLFLKRNTTYKLNNVIPNTEYEIRVQCRPEMANTDDVWSKFAMTNITTQSTTATFAPEAVSGCFQELEQSDELRSIMVYWKVVPEMLHNGPNLFYEINVENNGQNNLSLTQFTNQSFTRIDGLQMEESYQVLITAVNEQGKSENKTKIFIPAISEKIPYAEDLAIISDDNSNYEIFWRAPNRSELIDGYTVFWCHRPHQDMTSCENEISWNTVNASVHGFNLTLPNNEGKTLKFGIASESRNSSSGIIWAKCVPQHSTAQMFTFEGIIADESSVAINLKSKCNFGIIDRFIFDVMESNTKEYCKSNSMKRISKNATVIIANGSTYLHHQLREHLKPLTEYRFCMASESRGRLSNFQEFDFVRTRETAPHHKTPNGGIVAAIVLSTMICFAFIVFIIVKTWKRVRKIVRKYTKVELPKEMRPGVGDLMNINCSTEKPQKSANRSMNYSKTINVQPTPMPRHDTEDSRSTGKGSLSSTTTNDTRLSCDSTIDAEVFMPAESEDGESITADESMESPSPREFHGHDPFQYPVHKDECIKTMPNIIPGYTTITMIDCESSCGSSEQKCPIEKTLSQPNILQTIVSGKTGAVDLEDKSQDSIVSNKNVTNNMLESSDGLSTGPESSPWIAYSVFSVLENDSSENGTSNCMPQANTTNSSDCGGAEGYVKLDYIAMSNGDQDNLEQEEGIPVTNIVHDCDPC